MSGDRPGIAERSGDHNRNIRAPAFLYSQGHTRDWGHSRNIKTTASNSSGATSDAGATTNIRATAF